MAKKGINNTFIGGMNRDSSWNMSKEDQYLEAANFRPITDETGKSSGSLATVRGNKFNFSIPDVARVLSLKIDSVVIPTLNGDVQSMDITIGSVTTLFTFTSSSLEDLYKDLSDFINDPTSGFQSDLVSQFNKKEIALHSNTHQNITTLNFTNWSVNPLVTPILWSVKANASTDLQIIGSTELRGDLVLFTTSKSNDGNGQIWRVSWDQFDQPILSLRRHANDDFRIGWDIEAVSRYELNKVQRVYWTDFNNPISSINISGDESFLGESALQQSVSYDIPYVTELIVGAGFLETGWYSFSYRLLTISGGATSFSRFSQMFPLIKDEESIQYSDYAAGPGDEATSKALKVEINNIDTSYDFIEIVVAFAPTEQATPQYFLLDEVELSGNPSYSFVHGKNSDSQVISEAEIFLLGVQFSICKTIAIKDNRLIVGNIKSDFLQLKEYDTFTPRYPKNLLSTRGYSATKNKINPYNRDSNIYKVGSLRRGTDDADQHKHQENSSILGGGGPSSNIQYEFITENITLDTYNGGYWESRREGARVQPEGKSALFKVDEKISSKILNGKTVSMGGFWNNYKSPWMASLFRGYMRSEVYRFGIAFFSRTGEILETKWIDDIRMPEAYERPVFSTDAGGRVLGHPLGLKFTVNIPSEIASIISGFSIVRAERRQEDKNIIGQGLLWDVTSLYLKNSDDVLQQFLYRSDRIDHVHDGSMGGDGYDPYTAGESDSRLILELHTVQSPELAFRGYSKADLSGAKVRPIVGIQPKASRVITTDFKETPYPYAAEDYRDYNILPDISSSSIQTIYGPPDDILTPKVRWIKFFDADDYSQYYKDLSSTNNIVSLSMNVEESIYIEGVTPANPSPAIKTGGIFTERTYSWAGKPNGFINYFGPLYINRGGGGFDREITNEGNDQISFRGRGTDTILIRVPLTDATKCYTSSDTSPGGSSIANSRILPSPYYKNVLPGQANLRWGTIADRAQMDTFPSQRHLLFNFYKENLSSYGGDTFNAKLNTKYISTGHFQKVDGPGTFTCEVFGGDTYINVYDETVNYPHIASEDAGEFDVLKAFNNGKDVSDSTIGHISIFPVESDINFDWRAGIHSSIIGTGDYTAGNHSFYYSKNDSYSIESWTLREKGPETFISLDDFSLENEEWDNRVWASEAKTNGESINSWSLFKVLNIKEVDGDHGPINKLLTFNDEVLFWQDRAFGKLIVNPNPIIQASDDIDVALGSGKVLHDFNYLSTTIGSKHQWSVFPSERGVYFFDILNRQAVRYSGQTQTLGVLKGMHSFFTDTIDKNLIDLDEPSEGNGIIGTYDYLNNEAIFTFLRPKTTYDTSITSYTDYTSLFGTTMSEGVTILIKESSPIIDDSGTLTGYVDKETAFQVIQEYVISGPTLIDSPSAVYTTSLGYIIPDTRFFKRKPSYLGKDYTISLNEMVDKWTTFYDFQPKIYLNTKSRLLTPNASVDANVHLHNVGDYDKWYGIGYRSILEYIVNAGPDVTKVFDNVSWSTTAKSNSGAKGGVFDQFTFDMYYAYNDYQHTGNVTLDPSVVSPVIRKVEREWQIQMPRNIVIETMNNIDVLNPNNWDSTRLFNDRIRDKYLIQHFEYDGTKSDQFIVDYIKTYVRESVR